MKPPQYREYLFYHEEYDLMGVLEVISDTYKTMAVGFGSISYNWTNPTERGWIYLGEI